MSDLQVLVERGAVWLAGSAARPPGEPQVVIRLRRVSLDPRPTLRASRIEIPQIPDRHAVCLAKPVWAWGASLGVNELGVAIATTDAPTRGRPRQAGLIGLDLVRLGLERGATAREAVHVITTLLERHGQGDGGEAAADGGRRDAAFLVADPHEAWVLETAGRRWAARGVQRYWALSNALTLGPDHDLAAADLRPAGADFARRFGRRLRPRLERDHQRRRRMEAGLAALAECGDAEPADLFALLRRAGAEPEGAHAPTAVALGEPCRHAGTGRHRRQATNAMVARLAPEGSRFWFTGTAAPCLSPFRPVRLDDDERWSVLTPLHRELYAPLWRTHESLHRRALFDPGLRAELRADLAQTEAAMLAAGEPEADALAADWQRRRLAAIQGVGFRYSRDGYGRFWRRRNRADRIE